MSCSYRKIINIRHFGCCFCHFFVPQAETAKCKLNQYPSFSFCLRLRSRIITKRAASDKRSVTQQRSETFGRKAAEASVWATGVILRRAVGKP